MQRLTREGNGGKLLSPRWNLTLAYYSPRPVGPRWIVYGPWWIVGQGRLNFTEGTIIFYDSPNKRAVNICFIHHIPVMERVRTRTRTQWVSPSPSPDSDSTLVDSDSDSDSDSTSVDSDSSTVDSDSGLMDSDSDSDSESTQLDSDSTVSPDESGKKSTRQKNFHVQEMDEIRGRN